MHEKTCGAARALPANWARRANPAASSKPVETPRLVGIGFPCYTWTMKTYKFPVLIEKDEDGFYIGIVPDLKGCHTQAKTLAELEKRLKEAIALCLNVERKYFRQNKFVGLHQVELTA